MAAGVSATTKSSHPELSALVATGCETLLPRAYMKTCSGKENHGKIHDNPVLGWPGPTRATLNEQYPSV